MKFDGKEMVEVDRATYLFKITEYLERNIDKLTELQNTDVPFDWDSLPDGANYSMDFLEKFDVPPQLEWAHNYLEYAKLALSLYIAGTELLPDGTLISKKDYTPVDLGFFITKQFELGMCVESLQSNFDSYSVALNPTYKYFLLDGERPMAVPEEKVSEFKDNTAGMYM